MDAEIGLLTAIFLMLVLVWIRLGALGVVIDRWLRFASEVIDSGAIADTKPPEGYYFTASSPEEMRKEIKDPGNDAWRRAQEISATVNRRR